MVEKGPCAVSTNVSKPEKHGSGRSAVVDYLVTTNFDGGGESKTNVSLVRRTFEDFLWVQGRLVKERMGIIVPIISKKTTAKGKEQFMEPFLVMRQESCDRFLQRIIHHPELVDAPCLLPFFTANATDWIAAKALAKTASDKDLLLKENTANEDEADFAAGDTIHIDAQAAMVGPDHEKKKGPMRRWISNKRTVWALKNDNLNLEETPAEAKKFSDMKTYADHLEVCVRILSEDFKVIQSSNAVLAEKTGSMGAAFVQMWGEHDLSNTSSSNLYQSLGKVWANTSSGIQNHISLGERYFQSPVDDLVMDVVALQDALQQRKKSLFDYTKLNQKGKNLNKQLDRIRQAGNMTAQQEKYFKLESELRHCDERIAESQNHSDLVTSRLERDVDRFRVEWHERMRQVLETFHKQQVEFLQNQAKDFSSVLPDLAMLESKRSDLTTEAPQLEKLDIAFSVNSGGAKATIVGGNPVYPVGEAPAPPDDDDDEVMPQSPSDQDLEPISLDSSYSDEDAFNSDSAAMGGDVVTSKPILKSV